MKKSNLAFIALLGLAFIVVTPGISMAFDLFIRIDGVPGESIDPNHQDWIDGLSYSGSILSDGAGKSCFNDITILKEFDKASPKLSLYAAMGNPIDQMVIDFWHSGQVERRFLEIQLTGVSVTSISAGGSTQSDYKLVEEVAFRFSTIEWTYTIIDENGNPQGNVSERIENVDRCNGAPNQ